MPIPLGGNFYPFTQITGRNFYQISLRARQGAPHTRTGMPIALAVSHTSMHHRAHGVGPAGTTCMATSGSKAWLRRRLHAAIVREYLEMAMADE